ncbi:SDR family NAD(P)-dependent oxidoreductase [Hoeflea alexandrii]|uniref:SDR family NAD(P)-dependent oxidoreductase n=1 Tax=Hoeflea alexandrii TaxID=288436 RepID=UPI0022AE9037|nr:glucose 1-dehydrogenase [Hoeflea alexandrii]MCZ4291570.1 glucose 1-dehydrogenase [Hoeflea alexandrii]
MQGDWLELDGRIAVVTGGGGGIGRAIAQSLARQGCQVAVIDLDLDNAEETVRQIRSAKGSAIACRADVTDPESVASAARKVAAELGNCDFLINNAALLRFGPLSSLSIADWTAVLNVNLTGYFICSQVFAAQMITKGGGSIVHISSIAGSHVQPTSGAYSVSKAGVAMLSKNLAQELGPRGIRSNVVSPAMVITPLSEVIYRDAVVRKKREEIVPVRRIGLPEDIANAVVFLTSSRSGYISGQEILCDGGWGTTLLQSVPRPGFDEPND